VRKKGGFLIALGVAGAGIYTSLKHRSKPVQDHPFLAGKKPLAMAHRGGEGLWPSNTLYAFKRAVALGADVLEMDIHSTADGVLVVRHDPSVNATTNGSGDIRDLTLEQVKALDAGFTWTADNGRTYPYRGQGITIPTLEEVLVAFPDMRLNIDIKADDPRVVTQFCHTLRAFNKLDRVMVGSFYDHQLRRFRELCPEAATAAGVAETRLFAYLNLAFLGAVFQPTAQAFQIPEYAGRLHLVTERFVRAAHTHNMEVHVWTVDEAADMQRLLDWGVDGIFTDYPDRLMKVLER
jgi:glycerophosphoryl diester phosphodiesterase